MSGNRRTCPHKRTSLGIVYEYCEDCGAVRNRLKAADKFHTCACCQLKE